MIFFLPMGSKHFNIDEKVHSCKGNGLEKLTLFVHIPREHLGQPMNFLANHCI